MQSSQLFLKPILSPAEVADLIGFDVKTIYEAIHAGQLPAKRVGRRRFIISRDALFSWLASSEHASAEDKQ